MHPQAYEFVERSVRLADNPVVVVEIGSLNVNGGVRDLFPVEKYIGVDMIAGPGVDVVGDITKADLGVCADVVVCCEVLEHSRRAESIVHAAYDILKPGGLLILTTAMAPRPPHGMDGGPLPEKQFYRNILPSKLEWWLDRFTTYTVEIDEPWGDLRAVAFK